MDGSALTSLRTSIMREKVKPGNQRGRKEKAHEGGPVGLVKLCRLCLTSGPPRRHWSLLIGRRLGAILGRHLDLPTQVFEGHLELPILEFGLRVLLGRQVATLDDLRIVLMLE